MLDGELVIGIYGRLDFGQLQRRLASPARAGHLAATAPATLLVFDALVMRGIDVRLQPSKPAPTPAGGS